MMQAMPRPRPPYLQKHTTRHGRTAWYVGINRKKLIRLHAEYGTPEFWVQYKAAIDGHKPAGKETAKTGSLGWLWDRYKETTSWAELSNATRKQRENIMLHVLETARDKPYSKITTQSIEGGKDRRRDTPAQARNFLDCMRGFFRWAKAAKHVTTDPTDGVRNPKKKKGKGFPAWTEDDVAKYQEVYPLGTKERVWLDVLLYTGPRRGDACRIGRQHERMEWAPELKQRIRVIAFKTEKGGELIEVTIPLLPILQTTLDAGPTGDLTYICGEKGLPYTKESFGNAFSAAARKAGVPKSAHGVRKVAATKCADSGATVYQLMAIFGWTTTQMPELYTREANRKRLAREAAHTLTRTADDQPMLLPEVTVRAAGQIGE